MEIPNLVRERLGGESVEATISLGDEDVVCVTPSRTILYRGEGLLSDESVETYSHDVERLDLTEGRRNTKFVLQYVDGTEEFKVPNGRAETLLKILLQAMLREDGVAEAEESVAGVFQFSELTLVVTEARVVKHIGASVWDEDFEVFDYADVTGLEFEEGSVATQIVLTVDGRPQRIKAPHDKAPKVEQTLTQTLCAYYEVDSLEQLAAELGGAANAADDGGSQRDVGTTSDIELDDNISPLVGDESEDSSPSGSNAGDLTTQPADDDETTASVASADAVKTGASDEPESGPTEATSPTDAATAVTSGAESTADSTRERVDASETAADSGSDAGDDQAETAQAADVAKLEEQLTELTTAVKRQNKLLRKHNQRLDEQDERIAAHDEKIDQLIAELRQGR